ncbi:MAG: hypothetical protein ACPGRG_14015 [Marinomonas sp.]|jgi:hypothetical protein|uniref:Lipoprotein n=1 Tax=Marinomonas pontica TaxID=264739 RepID=A0ABM8FB30_9GAMM|nr:hypothetical protein [Marinomonas pontica]MCW8356957.1 hypothetical protein [Marinomonas pontica]BDX01390.1 hypothetical protein MACH16_01380 [Marinomonas pontica]
MKSFFLFFTFTLILGCSNKDVYSNLQRSHAFSCQSLKATQHEECMSQYSDSYEDYTAKRNGTLRP